MHDHVSRLSRRAFVAASAGAVAVTLTGCDAIDSVLGGDTDDTGAGSPTAPAIDADSVLVDEVGKAIAVAGALATATAKAVPALNRAGVRLARIHLSHSEELGRVDTVAAPTVSGDKAAALRALLASEAALQDRLVTAAGSAGSGALAQVFASMAAALAQQRAVLA